MLEGRKTDLLFVSASINLMDVVLNRVNSEILESMEHVIVHSSSG